MTLYLQIVIGDGRYLLDARQVLEVREAAGSDGDGPGGDTPIVDLRKAFAEATEAQGPSVVVAQAEGAPAAALIVDRVEGLAEIDDAAFCPLPPIGLLGALLDGVAMRPGVDRPLLRLRGECALAAAELYR